MAENNRIISCIQEQEMKKLSVTEHVLNSGHSLDKRLLELVFSFSVCE